MLGRASGDHRARLVLIAAFAVAVLVTLGAVVTQRGDRARSREVDVPDGRAGQASSRRPGWRYRRRARALSEGIEGAEGQYAVSANRGLDGESFLPNCSELSPERAKLLQRRTVVVSLRWPTMFPSAGLSQRTVFVANFEGEYRVWWKFH
ncbi:MAG: hypothetical protein M3358_09795 [Actinomycetota bacterium]|nr:hypothetical protein [Actinomycetota bacterium]